MSKTGLGLILFLIILGGSIFGIIRYRALQAELNQLRENPNLIADQELEQVVGQVGALIDLPTDEKPTLMTVTDADKIRSQTFFARSENGDKLLIYPTARKAILFRPSTNRIIDVATIDLSGEENNLSVSLLNGTNITGLTAAAEAFLADKASSLNFTSRANAVSQYTSTIVVDLTGGSRTTQATQLAQLLGGEVGTLPESETRPSGDIAIILGRSSADLFNLNSATPAPTSNPNQ